MHQQLHVNNEFNEFNARFVFIWRHRTSRNTAHRPSTQASYTASRVQPKRKISCAAAQIAATQIAATLTISFPRWRHMSLTSYWGQQWMSLTSYPGLPRLHKESLLACLKWKLTNSGTVQKNVNMKCGNIYCRSRIPSTCRSLHRWLEPFANVDRKSDREYQRAWWPGIDTSSQG